jgi:hypothetical protein
MNYFRLLRLLHMSLLISREARRHCEWVVLSLFGGQEVSCHGSAYIEYPLSVQLPVARCAFIL